MVRVRAMTEPLTDAEIAELRTIESAATTCQICDQSRDKGHDPDCELAALIEAK
jgi:hypothetical protein